jgi:hypothetical protein
MRKTILLSLLLCGASSSGLFAQARSPQTSFDTYYQECLARTRQQKLPADVAKDLCDCTMKAFRQRYSLPQFQELVRKSKGGDRTSSQTLTAVGEACFEQILYEE